MTSDSTPHYRHLEFPKTKDRKDFWGQVSRTVNGEPVSDEDIELIVDAIRRGLILENTDIVLDIGCGNGALSRFLFENVEELHGVDFSAYMIEIAKENFEDLPRFSFIEADAARYVLAEPEPQRFSKVLCYGVFPYLSVDDAVKMLVGLHQRFRNVARVYLGNLPDRDLAHQFYRDEINYKEMLDDPLAAIGVWRSREQMSALADECGWQVEYAVMPEGFYSAHYRYDAILTRKNP